MSHLYSQELKTWNEHLFQSDYGWGNNQTYLFPLNADTILKDNDIIKLIKPKSILDYGCGNGLVLQNICQTFPHIHAVGYDPFVGKYAEFPQGEFDLVLSYHAINNVEYDYWDETISKLQQLCKSNAFFKVVLTGRYPERTFSWYNDEFSKYFKIRRSFHDTIPTTRSSVFENKTVFFGTFWLTR
jgi:SAM-dependent methyltransferase